jgi:hypothetical protein
MPCGLSLSVDDIAGLSPEGDLLLASGQAVRLAGLRLPEDPRFRQGAIAWLGARTGATVVVQGPASPDRWGRRSVRLRLAGSPDSEIGADLLKMGLAIADPALSDSRCPNDFLVREAAARERSLGVWADAGYKPLDAEETNRLKERTGTFVLVEGRVRTVGERKQQTYLNFGGRWADDFTVIIPRRTWKQMTDRGIDVAALTGRKVRVRGILQAWQGASITVEIPEMIERLPR